MFTSLIHLIIARSLSAFIGYVLVCLLALGFSHPNSFKTINLMFSHFGPGLLKCSYAYY